MIKKYLSILNADFIFAAICILVFALFALIIPAGAQIIGERDGIVTIAICHKNDDGSWEVKNPNKDNWDSGNSGHSNHPDDFMIDDENPCPPVEDEVEEVIEKVNICHEAGDSGNWVEVEVSQNAWDEHTSAHSDHENDFLVDAENPCPPEELDEETPTETASCTLQATDEDVLVEFGEYLRADKSEDRAVSDFFSADILSGVYKVILQSFDNHSDKPEQTDQTQEEWYAKLFNGSSLVAQTSSIGDLPDDENSMTETVDTNLTVSTNVDKIQFRHAAYPNSVPNSINPVCALFEKVEGNDDGDSSPSVDISADPNPVSEGNPTVLSWTNTGGDGDVTCEIDQSIGAVNLNGSTTTAALLANTAFAITCTDEDNDQGTDSVTVTVNTNGGGGDNDSSPSVDISADPNPVSEGNPTVLSWTNTGGDGDVTCEIDQGIGAVSLNGSTTTAALSADTTFAITCLDDDNDQGTDSVTVAVDLDNGGIGGNSEEASGGSGGGGSSRKSKDNSKGEVLGATTCGIYLNDFLHISNQNNNPDEVKKLQAFLNVFVGANLALNGVFDQGVFSSVETFQKGYASHVLQAWFEDGHLETPTTPTGYVYITTRRKINLLMCPELSIPLPRPLTPDTNVMDNV